MANKYKKLVVFDLNMDWNKYDPADKRYRDIAIIRSLYQQAILYQPVAISSSGWYGDCLDYISKTGIKNGYLVADGGAVIYDIKSKEILSVNFINRDDVNTIIHHGIMLNINMLISTLTHKYVYVSDAVSYRHIKDLLYSQCEEIKSYEQLQSIILQDDIIDIAYMSPYDTGKNYFQRRFQFNIERYFDNEIHDLIIKTNQTSPLAHFSASESTKLKALQKVMAYSNTEHLNDILYIAATCINRECYLHFKNTLISSNPDFIVEISDCKRPKYISSEINNLTIDFGKETNSFWK